MTEDGVMRQVLAALEGIRFGSVEIVVHEGRIVQIERREKVRTGPGVTPPRPQQQGAGMGPTSPQTRD